MKQYSIFAVLSISMIVFAMAFVEKGNEYPDKHQEIVLRNIGQQVLLQSKDVYPGLFRYMIKNNITAKSADIENPNNKVTAILLR